MLLEPQLEATVITDIHFWDTLFIIHGLKQISVLPFPSIPSSVSMLGPLSAYFVVLSGSILHGLWSFPGYFPS